jgi:hypothetical protein
MDLAAVLDPPVEVAYIDAPQVLDATGEEWSQTITVADDSQPVRAMLVWTDAPGHGLGGSTPAWNNDLDLVVELGADTYLGNNFGGDGNSITGGAADGMNNTEAIFLPAGVSGGMTVTVSAANITSDGVPGSGDDTDQDFSLVVYNGLECIPPTVDFSIDPNPASTGQLVSFSADVSGGVPPYELMWDLDGDGESDATTTSTSHTYSEYFNGDVTLTVTDAEACIGSSSQTLLVNGARLAWSATGSASQSCGDGDQLVEPGELWSVPVTVANSGNQPASAASGPISVSGSPTTVSLPVPTITLGTVAAGGDATASFTFLVETDFTPCGATIQFNLDSLDWADGSSAGSDDVFSARTGGGTGQIDFLDEDFDEARAWSDWTVTSGPGLHNGGDWAQVDQSRGRPPGSSGSFAIADSDFPTPIPQYTSTILTSPAVDLSYVVSGPVTVEFDTDFDYKPQTEEDRNGDEHGYVEVWDGSTWQTVADYTADVSGHQSLEVTSHATGNAGFRVRFSYQDAQFDNYWAVDNVRLVGPVTPVCDNTNDCTPLFFDGFESGDFSSWDSSP